MRAPKYSCQECQELEELHEKAMEEYIALIDEQSRRFRQGQCRAAKDLDGAMYRIKAHRQDAIDALLDHQAHHWLHHAS
jgi:hypothetical protein